MMYYTSCAFMVALMALLELNGCQLKNASSWVAPSFSAPELLSTDTFVLKKLTTEYAEMDYEAVMESRVQLRQQFGGDWPADNFTLEQNKEDLQVHEQLFADGKSFTYSILTSNLSRVLGCVYINTIDSLDYDAQVHLWIRSSEQEGELELLVRRSVQDWLENDWPFEKVIYW